MSSGRLFQMAMVFSLFLLSHCTVAQNIPGEQKRNNTLLGLGDSITEGGNNFCSYLYPLWERLFVAGYQIEFIGPNQANTKIGGIDHAGYSGQNAEFLASKIDSIYSQYPADIALLHAGHNHFVEESPIAGIISAQTAIVKKIKQINPKAIVLIAKVIESGKLPKYSYIPKLNEAIDQMVAELQRSFDGVYSVNQGEGFDWREDTIGDKVHPNAIGAGKMEAVWFDKLIKVLEKPSHTFNPELVTYKRTPDELQLHIFRPENSTGNGTKPCIIFFFGGGWKVGTPLQFYREAAYFSSQGMVAVTADYRTEFENGSSVFESVSDAKSAVRWIRKNAARYGIDPNRIVAAGASAGGHLAAATATLIEFDEPEEDTSVSSRPNLNLLYYPVIDNGPDGYGSDRMKARYREISPLHNAGRNTPPTLILLGTDDPFLSVEKAEEYQALLERNGVDCELKLYPGAGHPIYFYRKGYSQYYFQTLKDSEDFLKMYGYLPPNSGARQPFVTRAAKCRI